MKVLVRYLFVATLLAFAFRLMVGETSRVSSRSMFPNMWQGDWALITKFDYNIRIPFSAFEIAKFGRPRRGEIASFCVPDRGIESFVKRVVAVAGDRMALQKGVLLINGQAAKYRDSENIDGAKIVTEEIPGSAPYRIEPSRVGSKEDYGPIDIPAEHFFALNDNRNDVGDSRNWGPVPSSCLSGRVKRVLLSFGPGGTLRKDRTGIPIN